MHSDAKAPRLPAQPLRFPYIHPVDLMETRLRNALQDSAHLIDVCLELYQLDYCRTDVGRMLTTKLRSDAYCDPYEQFERPALYSLKRAIPCAIGINDWLRWGMPARAGAFETELRTVLADLHSWVSHVRNLAFYPGLQDQRIRWEQNIAKGWDLLRELQLVAVESRSPAEWYDALQSALKVITAVDDAFSAYYESAKDLTADLSPEFNVLVGAFRPVDELLVRIGPRLVYAYDDPREKALAVRPWKQVLSVTVGD